MTEQTLQETDYSYGVIISACLGPPRRMHELPSPLLKLPGRITVHWFGPSPEESYLSSRNGRQTIAQLGLQLGIDEHSKLIENLPRLVGRVVRSPSPEKPSTWELLQREKPEPCDHHWVNVGGHSFYCPKCQMQSSADEI